MAVTDEEATAFLMAACAAARQHTEPVLAVSAKGEPGLGSSIVFKHNSERVGIVTCEHVVRDRIGCLVGPHRTKRSMVEEGKGQAAISRIVYEDREADLALIEPDRAYRKRTSCVPYNLSGSREITQALLSRNLGTGMVLCATWGGGFQGASYDDGTVFGDAPLYAGFGPLVSCSDTMIVGDFAERSLLYVGEKSYPKLAGVQPTGGVRNLKGISGSGFWMYLDGEFRLVGIIHGPNPGAPDQHLIRATPVWRAAAWIEDALRK